jgi:uracil phosphoribosyltransferase
MDTKLFVLGERDSIANQFLFELRDTNLQKDRMRFRINLERLGELLAYELSRKLQFETKAVTTPLGALPTQLPRELPVLVTILRAGIPFHQGFLNMFDGADCGFIGAFRTEGESAVTVEADYMSLPPVTGKQVILIDPMLATGKSVLEAQKLILSKGKPAHLFIVSVVAAPEGIKMLTENLTLPFSVWTCAVDERLNAAFYIVPGLGDAGDLSYGIKV